MTSDSEGQLDDALDTIRDHPEGAREIASLSGPVGAATRVLVALAHEESPAVSDLEGAGFVSEDADLGGGRLS